MEKLEEIVKTYPAIAIYHYPNRGWIIQIPSGEQGVSIAYAEKPRLEDAIDEIIRKLSEL